MEGKSKKEAKEIIQLHYWFKDEAQGMDALVQNRSEYEFISIIKEVASILEIHVNVQIVPYAAAGVRRCFEISFVTRESKIRKVSYQTIFTTLVTLYSSSTIEKPNTKAITQLFEKAVKATKMKGVDPFVKQQHLRLFKLDIAQKQQKLSESMKLIKRRSNMYEPLLAYTRMDRISFLIEDQDHNPSSKAIYVPADTFGKFILTSNVLDPVVIEETVIEIIAPVLKMGNYKWKGYYDGEVHDFNMLSTEFKTLVLSGRIEFKHGSAIRCCLEICKKINNQGEEEITRYNILRVDKYFDKEKPIETPEGRKYKYKKREKNAPTLFDGMDY